MKVMVSGFRILYLLHDWYLLEWVGGASSAGDAWKWALTIGED